MVAETSEPDWRTCTRCANTACVEVAVGDDAVLVRDSERRQARFSRTSWAAFIARVKAGDFHP